MRRAMDMLIDSYPAILGSDIAGVVEEVGEGVEGWKKGDEVFASAITGGYQQYVALPAYILMPVGGSCSFDVVVKTDGEARNRATLRLMTS
jgi:NADPH:quinone reductase-like Zn-dependent oxidoreductase